MATHSSILAWESSWTEEPGWLQFMGLQNIRQDFATKQQQHRLCHIFIRYTFNIIKRVLSLSDPL